MVKRSPTFVELFAGAGLFSYAFKKAGFRPLLAVEQDPDACHSFKHNIGDEIVCGDVRKLTPISKVDAIVAGPPCQGFSTLNKNRRDDPRNELCLEVIRWVRASNPKIVVIENVAPFATSDICKSVVRRLKRMGYESKVTVVNATQAGVAQHRQRSFLVATRNEIANDVELAITGEEKTVLNAWEDLPSPKLDPFGAYYPRPSKLALDRFRLIGRGGDRRDLMKANPSLAPPSWNNILENENTGVWGRMQLDRPAPTIRTCFQNPSKGRYIHPTKNRVISIREACRLQCIPDHWVFSGSWTQVCRQIGNGIPIDLGIQIAKFAQSSLLGKHTTRHPLC